MPDNLSPICLTYTIRCLLQISFAFMQWKWHHPCGLGPASIGLLPSLLRDLTLHPCPAGLAFTWTNSLESKYCHIWLFPCLLSSQPLFWKGTSFTNVNNCPLINQEELSELNKRGKLKCQCLVIMVHNIPTINM